MASDRLLDKLPLPPTPLLGREVGKTVLALDAARELRDAFPHGAAFVDLAPLRDPELVAAAIAQALGVREAPGQPLVSRLTAFLHEKQSLRWVQRICS